MFELPNKLQILGEDIQHHELKYHDRTVRLSKEFTFDSAHHLHEYDGACHRLHGHTYRLQVSMEGKPNDIGIVIDFSEMKRIVTERIIKPIDHHYLNDVLPPMNTTAENMVVWIYEQLQQALLAERLSPRVVVAEVKLWETPSSYAMVDKGMMEGTAG